MKTNNNDERILLNLCAEEIPVRLEKLHGGGGDRKYYRIYFESGETLIGVVSDDLRDAEAFVNLSKVFINNSVPVPRVIDYSRDFNYYLVEDLGDTSLYSLIVKNSSCVKDYVAGIMRMLARMQSIQRSQWENLVAYKPFDRRLIMWDLNYFKYEYLKISNISFNESLLEDDFEKLAERILETPKKQWGFQMRDCQSRNIMIKGDEPYFIDFQGGRFGPSLYDAVSFLWQAKANFSEDFKMEMLDVYANSYAVMSETDKSEILRNIDDFILLRNLQVLGAYGFRGLIQKRAHFIESIPNALNNMKNLLDKGSLDIYPEIKKICMNLCKDERFVSSKDQKLNINIFSFSYKKGYPDDFSGNGGGFMFDCRGMHNPGRYEEYKSLTGRDMPVIKFLKEKGETDLFVSRTFELIAPTIERYIKRGFSSLQIGFGCTGGQHRSVYCADNIAKMISRHFPDVKVHLTHREQGITELLNSKI